jgi:hypothetical protein|eukprot:COSAG06_NODE_3524_length_5228_cov_160.163580_4_plen_48_part_00
MWLPITPMLLRSPSRYFIYAQSSLVTLNLHVENLGFDNDILARDGSK